MLRGMNGKRTTITYMWIRVPLIAVVTTTNVIWQYSQPQNFMVCWKTPHWHMLQITLKVSSKWTCTNCKCQCYLHLAYPEDQEIGGSNSTSSDEQNDEACEKTAVEHVFACVKWKAMHPNYNHFGCSAIVCVYMYELCSFCLCKESHARLW